MQGVSPLLAQQPTLPAKAQAPGAGPQQPAQTTGRAEAEALRARAAERMKSLQREADQLAASEQTLVSELRRLEVQRDLRTEELKQAEADLAQVTRAVEAAAAEVQQVTARLDAARPVLVARLLEIYRRGRPGYARLVLSVEDPREIGRALRVAGELARLDRERIRAFENDLVRLGVARTELEQRAAQAAHVRHQRALARDAVERAVAARAARVREIDGQRDLAARLVAELDQAQDRLRRTIAAMTLDPSAAASALDAAVLPMGPFRGDLPWPVEGEVSLGFGTHRNPRFGTTTIQTGIEITTSDQAIVRAIHEGRVVFADVYAGYGQVVILDHGSQNFSLYGFLAAGQVAVGSRVRAGDRLGTAGSGPSGSAALYFELRIDGKPVDPLQWLRTRR